MICQSLARLVNLSLVVGGIVLWCSAVQATGRWNLPSTVPQFFGYGNGPGYHAPRIHNSGYYPPKMPRRISMPNQCPSGACGHFETMLNPTPDSRMETSPVATTPSKPSTPSKPDPSQQAQSPLSAPMHPSVRILQLQSSKVDSMEYPPLFHQQTFSPPSETFQAVTMEAQSQDREEPTPLQITVAQTPIKELEESWLVPVPLPPVAEYVPEPAPLILLPPVTLMPEAPTAVPSEQSKEMKTVPQVRSLRDALFSAPPLPGNQG